MSNVGDVFQVLAALIVGGLMGLLGQGVRAVVGMKTMVDEADRSGVDQDDIFRVARLLFSLLLGFLVGIAAAISIGLDKLLGNNISYQVLLGLAAAGYAGADFLEGFISTYLPGAASKLPQNTNAKAVLMAAAAAALPAPISKQRAQDIVFGVILARFPNAKISSDQPLSQYGYTDLASVISLSDGIYSASKIYVKAQDIINCTKISDVISLVQAVG